jgi:RNA methyltransferase, TrmH family
MSREPTEKVVGLAAAYAVMRVRPRDVLNVAHSKQARRELSELLREAARLRIAYRELPQEDLDALSETVHNEGVCLLVRLRPEATVDVLARAIAAEGLILALDHVENPHNVGALLRSAAFFGARGMLLSGPRKRALTPSSIRVAEGGAEHVPVCAVPSLAPALSELRRAGAAIAGADAHRGESATRFRFPSRVVLVLGSERHGLSPDLEAVCTDLVHIRGTDAVESLNVSVAAGILLALATRKGRAP